MAQRRMQVFDRPGVPIGSRWPFMVVKSNGVWLSKHESLKLARESLNTAMAMPLSMGGYDALYLVDAGGNVIESKSNKGRSSGRTKGAEPRFGKKLGTFEFDRMNRTSRQKVGALMTQYHGSMGDPYYAVGSFYISDHAYPKLDIVESALGQVESDIRKAEQGLSGWGKQEAMELRAIKRYLKWDIARMKGAAGHASGKKLTRAGHNKALFAKMSRRKAELMRKGRSAEGAGQQAYRETFGARNRAERARRTSGRSSGEQIAAKDRRKVILAIYRATNVSDKMLRNKKHTVMLVGEVAKRYGAPSYTNIVLEDANCRELLKLAEAYQILKSQRVGRVGGRDDSSSHRTRREAARIAELIWTHRKKNHLSPRMTEPQIRKAAELVGSGGVSGMTDLVVREYKLRLAELN